MSDNYEDLDSFASDYKPNTGIRPGLDTLSDGEYDFEIVEAKLDRTPKSGDRIFRMILKVLATGSEVEKVSFLKTQGNMNALTGELISLGLDADKWATKDRPLSKELPVAGQRLKGLCFRGKKVTNKEEKDTYHNLYVQRLIAKGGNGTAPAAAYEAPSETIPF